MSYLFFSNKINIISVNNDPSQHNRRRTLGNASYDILPFRELWRSRTCDWFSTSNHRWQRHERRDYAHAFD